MPERRFTSSACALASLLFTVSVSAHTPQDKPPVPPAAASPERLTGEWRFNKELSTLMPDPEAATDPGGGRRGPGGGAPGGGGGRGGGGRSYGGGGARGGGTRSSAGSTEEMLQARALLRELADVPAVLTIIAAPSHVTITTERGTIRKFTPGDAAQEVDLGTAKATAKATWDQDVLTVDWTAGKARFTESYQVTVQGHMLVIRIAPVAAGNTPGTPSTAPIKYIFDRVEAADRF